MPAGAMVLPDGRIVTGKNSSLLGPSAAPLMLSLIHIYGVSLLPQPLQQGEAVHSRQHGVQHHQIVNIRGGVVQPR